VSQPAVSDVTQWSYDRLPQPWRTRDEDSWLLLAFVEGVVGGLDEAWRLAEDPGPRGFFADPDIDAKWLPHMADRNGARLSESMTEAQRRAEVANPTGWRRTLPASIRDAALQYLPEGAAFLLRMRTNPDVPGDEPAHVSLTLHEDDIDPGELPAILAAFEATIPVGMFGHLIVTGQWWAEESAAHATHALAAAAHATHAHQAEGH
jgi:hypothetical protein